MISSTGFGQCKVFYDKSFKRSIYEDLSNLVKDSFNLNSSYIFFELDYNGKTNLIAIQESANFHRTIKREINNVLKKNIYYFKKCKHKIIFPIFIINNSDTSIENNSIIKKLTLAVDDNIIKKIFLRNNISIFDSMIISIQPPENELKGKLE